MKVTRWTILRLKNHDSILGCFVPKSPQRQKSLPLFHGAIYGKRQCPSCPESFVRGLVIICCQCSGPYADRACHSLRVCSVCPTEPCLPILCHHCADKSQAHISFLSDLPHLPETWNEFVSSWLTCGSSGTKAVLERSVYTPQDRATLETDLVHSGGSDFWDGPALRTEKTPGRKLLSTLINFLSVFPSRCHLSSRPRYTTSFSTWRFHKHFKLSML